MQLKIILNEVFSWFNADNVADWSAKFVFGWSRIEINLSSDAYRRQKRVQGR